MGASLPDEVYEFECEAASRSDLRALVEKKLRAYYSVIHTPQPIEHLVNILTFIVTDESHEVQDGTGGVARELTRYRAEVRATRTGARR